MRIVLHTIGFSQTPADRFFEAINREEISTLIDVRLNNISQLSGFTKKNDLRYFLKKLCDIEYIHALELAPTKEMLDGYKKHKDTWEVYAEKFMELMYKRGIEKHFHAEYFNHGCLLCSEKLPHHCHRSLVSKYLQKHWSIPIDVKHLF